MSWITKAALKRRWLTLLIAALVAGASVWAVLTLKMELIPDIQLPMTTVVTVYPQAQPEEVMEQVTVPIEGTAAGISGLLHTSSSSSENSSVVFFQFEYGTDMGRVNAIIAERLDDIELPPEVRSLPAMMPGLDNNPRLYPIDLNQMPVVILSLYGDFPAQTLEEVAVSQVVPALEGIEGVLSVPVTGGTEEKLLVNPVLDAMIEEGVSMGQLAAVLQTTGYDSLESLRSTVLRPDGLLLEDVAQVKLDVAPGASITRTNGKPSVRISITKETTANTVNTANAVLKKAHTLAAALPAGLSLATVLDQSEYIEASVSDLTNNALIGSALAIAVVFLFLLAFRASLVTALSIPLSLLVGFLVMRFTGLTINILTLSAMVIAVGRVIDNSIVILEVLYRRMQQGERFADATINGVREVVAPITSATIATVVIFLPLAFVGGMVGEMFIPFGLTLTYALIGSLLIALTVVPALSGYLLRARVQTLARSPWYLGIYGAMLGWCLRHRAATVAIAAVLFLGSFALLPIIGTTFMPEMNTSTLMVDIEMPGDTSMARMEQVAADAERILGAHADVLTYSTEIGPSSGALAAVAAVFGGGNTSSFATITVVISPDADGDVVADSLRSKLEAITNEGTVTVRSREAMAVGTTSRLEISVRGDSYQDINAAAESLAADLRVAAQGGVPEDPESRPEQRRREMEQKALSHIEDIELEIVDTKPKLIVEPDPARVMTLGFTMEQIASLQKELFIVRQGASVGEVELDGIVHEVFLQGLAEQLTDPDVAARLRVGFPNPVALGDIATVAVGEQPTSISRYEGKVAAAITANITQENVGAVNRAVQSRIDSLDVPPGVEISMGGITEDMMESFSDMYVAIGIAMVLAFVVLVVTFRSIRNPLIIMVSLPLASIGALLGLFVAGRPLGVTGLMGILMLVGIVLTNAVVLVAVVEQLRRGGMDPYQAVVAGARTRLRPILMTAITTIIAMVPLALGFGQGVLMAAELATVVIGGLFSSTFLTLLVIPAVYAIVNRIRGESTPVIPMDETPETAGPQGSQ